MMTDMLTHHPRLQELIAAGYAASRTDREWPTLDGTSADRNRLLMASEANFCTRLLAFSKSPKHNQHFGGVDFKQYASDDPREYAANLKALKKKLEDGIFGYFAADHSIKLFQGHSPVH